MKHLKCEEIRRDIDRKARREFSIHARFAEQNGYTLQAKGLENDIMPRIDAKITEINADLDACRTLLATKPHLKTNWRWKPRAEAMGMGDQYQFFYRYASRLMHAEPVSFATHQQVLESYEIIALLDYIDASIDDALDLAARILLLFPRSTPNDNDAK